MKKNCYWKLGSFRADQVAEYFQDESGGWRGRGKRDSPIYWIPSIGRDACFCLLFILAFLRLDEVIHDTFRHNFTKVMCSHEDVKIMKILKVQNGVKFTFRTLDATFYLNITIKKSLMHLNNVSSLTHLDKCVYKRPINVVLVYKNRIFARPTALLRKSFLSFSFFCFWSRVIWQVSVAATLRLYKQVCFIGNIGNFFK